MGRDKRVLFAGLALLCTFVFVLTARGADVPTLTVTDLKALLDSDRRILVVDTRSEADYVRGHIPGAILIPGDKAWIAHRFLPGDTGKETTIVFYCLGTG